jgi:hypothetical protein
MWEFLDLPSLVLQLLAVVSFGYLGWSLLFDLRPALSQRSKLPAAPAITSTPLHHLGPPGVSGSSRPEARL